jgi:hypothetical protein
MLMSPCSIKTGQRPSQHSNITSSLVGHRLNRHWQFCRYNFVGVLESAAKSRNFISLHYSQHSKTRLVWYSDDRKVSSSLIVGFRAMAS